MSYPYRNTYRMDNDTFVEDRGYAHTVKRGEPDFAALETEFAAVPVGSTAARGMNGEGWNVVEGCPFMAAYAAAAKAPRLAAIKEQLTALDAKSARPLRSVVAGTATDEDKAMLDDLELQAQGLRQEMKELEG